MLVKTLDHVNIVCADLDGTARFYAELLDLERRDGPPPFGPDEIQWMHDGEGRAVLHLNAAHCPRRFDRTITPGEPTGAIHHVALACRNPDEVRGRLEARGMTFEMNRIDAMGLTQIFTHDPNGVLLELNFFGE